MGMGLGLGKMWATLSCNLLPAWLHDANPPTRPGISLSFLIYAQTKLELSQNLRRKLWVGLKKGGWDLRRCILFFALGQ